MVGARALIVFMIALGMLTTLPMQSPDAQAARLVNSFDDGTQSKIVEFTTDPLPGERVTLHLKLRGDVTVTQAAMNASAVLLERSFQATGTGLVGLGAGIDNSGDYDNDGYNDLFVTAPGTTNTQTSEGFLAAVRGSSTGLAFPPSIQMYGGVANALFGWAISMGDLNEDGYDDLIASRIEMDFTTSSGTGTGDVLIFWGARTLNSTADVTLSYGASGDMFGYSVSTHGDVNDDGHLDLVVGSPRNEVNTNNPGRVFIYYGTGNSSFPTTPDVTLTGTDNGDGFGRVVHICGDVNDDGIDDIFVGAPGHNGTTDFDVGKAYVYYGGASGVDTTADWTYTGSNEEDYLGYSGTGLLDVNDDGVDDLAVGVPLWDEGTTTDCGETLVFYGGSGGPSTTPDVTIEGDITDGFLGVDMASAEDINDDGLGDLVIGVPNSNNGSLNSAGHIQVHFGNENGLPDTPDKILRGWTADGDSGFSVGPGGDIDGDGYDDINTGDPTGLVTYNYFGGPSAPGPAIYVDDVEVWSHSGSYVAADRTDDFADVLNAYIATHQGDVDINGDLLIPINISMTAKGRLKLDDIFVQFYRLVQPTGLVATATPTGGSIKLTWDDHTIKMDDISKMSIEMWNGTDWEEVVKAPKNAKDYTVTGLTDGVQYQFRLRAFDGAVQAYSEPSDTAIAIPGDTKAPGKVMNVQALEDRDVMGINLSWDASDEDTVVYEVYSNKTGTWEVLANVSGDMTYYMDTDVQDGPWYWYKVRAWDEVPLVGEFSNIFRGRLQDLDGPAIPQNLQITTVPTGRALKLTWDLNTDDTVAYSLESNKTGPWKEVVLVGKTVTQYIDTGLTDGTTYWYRLSARDESDNPSNYTEKVSAVPVDETPPMTPTNLEVSPRSQGRILELTWDLNTDDTVAYNVYMYNDSAGDFTAIAQVLGIYQSYAVHSLINGESYRFRLKAQDAAAHESDWSNEVTGIPTDTFPPAIPQGLEETLDPDGGAVNLSWNANNDDTAMYRVFQWDGSAWVELGSVNHPATWFEVRDLVNNEPYAFVVRAVDGSDNESPNSARVDVIPKDSTPPPPPEFVGLPEVTNSRDLTVNGVCAPHATITVVINLLRQDPVVCDEYGAFSVDVNLKGGVNEITADAVDDSGISTSSARRTVRVDTTAPEIDRTDPEGGTRDVSHTNLTFQVYFSEDVTSTSLKCFLRKGRLDTTEMMAQIGSSDNIVPRMTEYDKVRYRATFEVDDVLAGGSAYTILVYDVEDVAGNAMDSVLNGYSFQLWTVEGGSGGGGGGGGGTDDGLGSMVWIIAAAVVIVLVVIVAFLLVSRSGTTEQIEVERSVIEAGPDFDDEPVPAARPDIQTMYASAYEERGEEATEHHEVDAGLGDWLAEQERASQAADEEARRLMDEMKTDEPVADDGEPIPEIPPDMLPESEYTAAYHMDAPETEAEPEAEEEPEPEPEEEPEEESEPESEEEEPGDEDEGDDDAAALLDELEDDLEAEREKD